MLIGYARISKADGSQSLDLQRDALREAGVSDDAIYEDQASGQRLTMKKRQRLGAGGWHWCMNRNWPATNPTHRSITYQERTTMAYRARPSEWPPVV